jgi:NAD(P) transhydrogenase
LGHDRDGRLAALAAAQRAKRVALVECREDFVLPNSSLRDAALLLAKSHPREESLRRSVRERRGTLRQLWQVANDTVQQQASSLETALSQQGADYFDGQAQFVGPNELEVSSHANGVQRLTGDNILLAVGTKPNRPSWVPFDGRTILDSDELLALPRLPKSMIVIGSDVAALESAMCFAVLGTRVVFVDPQPKLLASWDREVIHRFRRQAARCGVRFRLGREVLDIEKTFDERAAVRLEGGKNLLAECVLYAAGRRGNTNSLNLNAAGLFPDEQGRLWCNEQGQTWIKHIYGIGDVVGFPVLARASLNQSRRVIESLFGTAPIASSPISRGLLTTPELAMVGATEEQLRHDLVAYEVGVARFADTSRSEICGSPAAMLKLLFHRESLELLGVHCLSGSATELIRLGETVMSLGGTIESFLDKNMAEAPLTACYRQAADNGLARLADESHSTLRSPQFQSRLRQRTAKHRRLALSPR